MEKPVINIDASRVTSEIFAWLMLIASYQAMNLHVAQGKILDEKAQLEIQMRVVKEWQVICERRLASSQEGQ